MKITEVTSRQNSLIKELYKLSNTPSGYIKEGRVWLEGEHLCQAYLEKVGQPLAIVCNETVYSQQLYPELLSGADDLYILTDSLFRQVSHLQSVAGIGFMASLPQQEVLSTAVPTIIFDRLQDPGNVGSILRSAAAFGFEQVIALKGTCALWSHKVLRAAMGAHFNLKVVEQQEPKDLDHLKLPLLTTSSHSNNLLHKSQLPWPCAWVIGNEGQGIDEKVLNKSSLTVCIQQPGGEESLNAAIAASICMYETIRQINK